MKGFSSFVCLLAITALIAFSPTIPANKGTPAKFQHAVIVKAHQQLADVTTVTFVADVNHPALISDFVTAERNFTGYVDLVPRYVAVQRCIQRVKPVAHGPPNV